jgi:hypothetical protein
MIKHIHSEERRLYDESIFMMDVDNGHRRRPGSIQDKYMPASKERSGKKGIDEWRHVNVASAPECWNKLRQFFNVFQRHCSEIVAC